MENRIKMDDLGVPVFSETPISRHPTLSQVGDKSIFVHKSEFCILAEFPISFRVFIPEDALVKLVVALMGETKGKIT